MTLPQQPFHANDNSIGKWLRDHLDLALVLAAATEIPRWTVAFLAIHEPLWVGVPLGALLAWALKDGWSGYFRTKRTSILALNLAALLTAILVITPVLYAMTFVPVEQVDLTAVFGDNMPYRMAWAGLLALSTFLPLIQLSAVRSIADVARKADTDATPTKMPRQSQKRQAKRQTPTTDTDLERMLADVNLDGQTPESYWYSVYSGKAGDADKLTAQRFGVSPRTVQRQRLTEWKGSMG